MTSETEKSKPRLDGNFPVDQYMIDYFDPTSGELTFTKRISNSDRYLNKAGQEIPDPRPAAPALGKKPGMNIRDYIATMVRSEKMQQELDAQGVETFEEANDFEVGEDYFPDSQYENDLEPSVAELIREGTASLSAKARIEEKRLADLKAQKRAARAQTEEEDSFAPEPKKSPRRPRKGPADDPLGSSDGDPDPGE